MNNMNVNPILFAVDVSPASRTAIPTVVELARLLKSPVLVTHVWNMAVVARDGIWDVEMPGEARELLNDVAAQLREGGATAEVELRSADPRQVAQQIVSSAREHSARMIVVGSRGKSDLRGLFTGSVSHAVIANSDCPVLVARASSRKPDIKRILLAIAGGEEVAGAMELTRTLAGAAAAEVLVLHARYLVSGGEGPVFVETDEEVEIIVGGALAELRQAGINAISHSPLAGGGIPREIVRQARDWSADVIVLGSRRLSEVAALFLGAIDHDVIHLSERPVLIAGRPTTAGHSETRP